MLVSEVNELCGDKREEKKVLIKYSSVDRSQIRSGAGW